MNEIVKVEDVPRVPLASGHRPQAIIPSDFEGVWRFSKVVAASGMAPPDFSTVEKIAVAVMHGLEVGLSPMAALQSIAVIKGRPSIWGDGALGLVRGSGLLEQFIETIEGEGDARVAMCMVKRAREAPMTRRFSVGDAKRAGLWDERENVTKKSRDGGGQYQAKNDSPWYRYPMRMLAMRARAWALRDGFADVLRGLHIAEEAMDIPARDGRDATPPAAPIAASAPAARIESKAASKAQAEPAEFDEVPPSPSATKSAAPAQPAQPASPAPTADDRPDPEATYLEAEADFAAAADIDRLVALWDYKYQPLADVMLPPDAEHLMGIYRKNERRLAP